MQKVYLDSSALVKRYVSEKGSADVSSVYKRSNGLEVIICFSIWNMGEAIGVIDHYRTRGWLTEDQSLAAFGNLAGETLRLSRMEYLELIPLDSAGISDTWDLIRRYHIYQADALQIVSCRRASTDIFVSADKGLLQVARHEGLKPVDVEDHGQMQESVLMSTTHG